MDADVAAVARDAVERRTARARVVHLARHVLSARFAFVDVPSGRDRSVLVMGSGRSGTTWVAELINFRNDFRTIWEPFNTVYSPLSQVVGFRWGEYLHPREPAPRLERLFRDLLEGRVSRWWIDWHNTRRVPIRRLVKTIETTNLRGWLHLRFPEVPMVYVVRHPFAFAESHVDLGWSAIAAINAEVFASAERVGSRLGAERQRQLRALAPTLVEPFEQLVYRWCVENALALHHPIAQVHTLFYEDLVLDTRAELDRLSRHLDIIFDEHAIERSFEPSRTDYRDRVSGREASGSGESFVAAWQSRVPVEQRERGLRVLDAFGLLDFYDDTPLPLGRLRRATSEIFEAPARLDLTSHAPVQSAPELMR